MFYHGHYEQLNLADQLMVFLMEQASTLALGKTVGDAVHPEASIPRSACSPARCTSRSYSPSRACAAAIFEKFDPECSIHIEKLRNCGYNSIEKFP